MVKEIRIYCEGDPDLREGFHAFLSRLRDQAAKCRCAIKCLPRGANAIRDFAIARNTMHEAWCILLIDAEGPDNGRLFEEWAGVRDATPDSVFWMVQLMESWFLADPAALKDFYQDGFQDSALRKNPRVEEIPKQDVIDSLDRATRNCRKGKYSKNKVEHANQLLRRIDPDRVCESAPNCARLFQALHEWLLLEKLKDI